MDNNGIIEYLTINMPNNVQSMRTSNQCNRNINQSTTATDEVLINKRKKLDKAHQNNNNNNNNNNNLSLAIICHWQLHDQQHKLA